MRVVKLEMPVRVEFAKNNGVVQTREGPVAYEMGDALLTGIEDEQWPISRQQFFQTYMPVPPIEPGQDGDYQKNVQIVEATQIHVHSEIALSNEMGALQANPGDWLINVPGVGRWVVADSIFRKTYRIVEGSSW